MAYGSQYNINYGRRSSGTGYQLDRDDVYNYFGNLSSSAINQMSNNPSVYSSLSSSGGQPLSLVMQGLDKVLSTMVGSSEYYDQLENQKRQINNQVGLYQYGLEYNRLMQQEANALSYLQSQEANQTEIDLLNQMNSFNVEQWERNNQYNSPAAVLQRAQAAGINPNAALGSSVASSPVQQTSIPNMAVGNYGASSSPGIPNVDWLPHRSQQNLVNQLSDMAHAMMKIPEYAERVEGMRLDNDAKRLDNDAKRNEQNIYSSFSFYQNPKDPYDIITQDEYDALIDDDKKVYYKDGSDLPNLVKPGFKSKAGYDAFMDLHNVKKRFADDAADISQDKLRKMVTDGKLKDEGVVHALINMEAMEYSSLYQGIKKTLQDIKHIKKQDNYTDKLIEIADQNLEEMKAFSLPEFVKKLKEGNISWEDALFALIALWSKRK